jgi:prepilin-type N-terminal cleavage/methylation domain-containing protein
MNWVKNKTAMKNKLPVADSPRRSEAKAGCRLPVEKNLARAISTQNSKLKTQSFSAFTLIELLAVIAIIAIIAALLMPVGGIIVRKSRIQHAQSERDQIETAIESYHSAYGFYPPDNPGNALTNQLYYELLGTTTSDGSDFTNLDNSHTIQSSTISTVFGVGGFMNCTKSGAGEDASQARNFFPGLKPGQIATNVINNDVVAVIVTAVNSDNPTYQPMPGFVSMAGSPANPWRYLCPGTNNPTSYDLWLQLVVGDKTNLICNWKSQPQINSPLP